MTFARHRIFFSPADKVRAERVIKHITLLDKRTIQDPEPYVNCKEVIPSQRRCRYPDRLYRTAFYHDPRIRTSIPPEGPPDLDRETTTTYEHHRYATSSDTVIDENRSIPLTKTMIWNTAKDWFGMHVKGRDRLTRFDRLCVIIFSSLNGGIHLAAWNSVFPTQIEMISWKVSSIIIMNIIPAFYIHGLLASSARPGKLTMCVESGQVLTRSKIPLSRIRWQLMIIWLYFGRFCMLVIGVAFVATRVYLLVESFISLRHMPYGVFVMPSWLEVLPHL